MQGQRCMEWPIPNSLIALSGFVVGAIVGLTGVGGGSLMTPILILLFGIHPATAVGTDLLYASLTKAAGTTIHGIAGTIDWRVVGRLACGSVPAAVVTMYLFSDTPAGNILTNWVLGIALCATAMSLIFRRDIENHYRDWLAGLGSQRIVHLTILTGMILGFLVSVSSVGAGAIGVTALILLYPRLPIARVVASDIAHAVPLTLIAGVGHWVVGLSDLGIVGSLLTGSIPGIILGSLAAPRIPESGLRFLLAGTLLIVGGRLIF